jgi:molybdopterin-guanine dinucleotide biosynthesis protein A
MVRPARGAAIYILAGGESRRMGQDKAWVEWAGEPLIERILTVAEEVGPIAGLVVSPRQARSAQYRQLAQEWEVRLLPDRVAGLGPLGGLATALHDAGPEMTVLLLAVDLPGLTPDLLRRLLTIHRTSRAALTLPLDVRGRLQPLTACYQSFLAPFVDELLTRGERRLASLPLSAADSLPGGCQILPFSSLADLPGASELFRNCNCPADLSPLPG